MKKVFSVTLIISVVLISCFTEQPTKSEKLTSKHLTQAEYVNLLDKIVSGEIDGKQTKHIVSKLHSGESYDNALKGLPPKSKESKIEPPYLDPAEFPFVVPKSKKSKIPLDKADINEVLERLDRIEHNIKTIATFLEIEMDEKGRIINTSPPTPMKGYIDGTVD